MTKRFVAFFIWATCVWACVSAIGIEDERETVDFVVVATGSVYLPFAALTLAFQERVRKSVGSFGAYLFALVGRTVVPLVAASIALRCCDERVRFEIAVRVIIGYFGVAPVHVWATIPWKGESIERAKFRNASVDRCENDRYGDQINLSLAGKSE